MMSPQTIPTGEFVDDITLAVTSDGKGRVNPGKTQLAIDRVSALAKRDHMMVKLRKCSTYHAGDRLLQSTCCRGN